MFIAPSRLHSPIEEKDVIDYHANRISQYHSTSLEIAIPALTADSDRHTMYYRETGGGGFSVGYDGAATSGTFTISGLTPNTSYDVFWKAWNDAGGGCATNGSVTQEYTCLEAPVLTAALDPDTHVVHLSCTAVDGATSYAFAQGRRQRFL